MLPTIDTRRSPPVAVLAAASRRQRRRLWQHIAVGGICSALLLPLAVFWLRPYVARLRYQPREGDVVLQSLPLNPLVAAIEGATESPFSHCGLVARRDDRWVVIEALHGVEETPLNSWLARGRGGGFAVYRFRPEFEHIPETIAAARRMLGRPYDPRYRWDDEQIYCSELVSKAFEQAAGRQLGKRVRLGELHWQRFRPTIERIEGGVVPLDREMVTPRDLAAAEELQEVARFGL